MPALGLAHKLEVGAKRLVDGVTDYSLFMLDPHGRVTNWNRGAERLFGYTAEQTVGRHISLIIPPERLYEEDQIIAKLKAGQRVEHYETERRRSDGKMIVVSLAAWRRLSYPDLAFALMSLFCFGSFKSCARI